mgnify:CR=1
MLFPLSSQRVFVGDPLCCVNNNNDSFPNAPRRQTFQYDLLNNNHYPNLTCHPCIAHKNGLYEKIFFEPLRVGYQNIRASLFFITFWQ